MLDSWILTLLWVDVKLFHLVSCFAFNQMTTKHVIRKFRKQQYMTHKLRFSYDGTSVQTEPRSNFPHIRTALASYRGSAFVTGHNSDQSGGLKTEILDYQTSTWVEADDYPYDNTNYVSFQTLHRTSFNPILSLNQSSILRISKYAAVSTAESVFINTGNFSSLKKYQIKFLAAFVSSYS